MFSSSPNASTQELFAKFLRKTERASKGELTFGRGHRFDVDEMVTHKDILEIKYRDLPIECEKQGQWVRLYFSEPEAHKGILLGLTLRLKKVGSPDLQTQDAREAFQILEQMMGE
ncbi:hypothetical protein CAQU_12210 [Corynebacterium aquilae DSM 44791]|uniref:Uncharacterized protein n=1 Tax=Corynebacterium aquilae DSM 44791 TaxID=1431546 RepID=A0A1L7CIJ8_9CORY|nr:hypothetical protein CAQU_12210 [Corynebacterium aquilae DSM 44791]